MVDDFLQGMQYLISGLRWLPRPGLRRFVVVPLLINVVLFGLFLGLGIDRFQAFTEWLEAISPDGVWWVVARGLLWIIFTLTFLAILYYAFTATMNFIAAPFNVLLAKRVEQLACPGQAPTADSIPAWREWILAPLQELRKLIYFLSWALLLFVLSGLMALLLPPLSFMIPILWVILSAWMLALEYFDYPMGNQGIGFRAQRRILVAKRPMALGFGLAVLILTIVPIINLIAMPAAVVGATLLWVDRLRFQ